MANNDDVNVSLLLAHGVVLSLVGERNEESCNKNKAIS